MSNMFIPKKIKAGYQHRAGTYTNKLAYVIYYDQKGVLHKQKSWDSWRDSKIDPQDFDNVPTEGFVLNKHVGGYKSDWNFRQSYCRVFDPRGFEIEISIENLLYILDWVDCYHGKGLDGKFVYGWDGTDLFLIPCCTDDYSKYVSEQSKMFEKASFKASDMIEGSLYKFKEGYYWDAPSHDLVYVGKAKIAKAKTDVYGTQFESKCLFADPTDHNIVYKKDPSRILYKVSDNVLSADEIQDIMYRFNLTAFSKEFWTTSNIIDHFEQNYTIGYDEGRPYNVVTDDGKGFFVKKAAQKLAHTCRSWYYKIAGYYTYCKFDRDMSYEIINDYLKMSAGRALADYYSWDEYNYYLHMYPGLTREGINAMFESLEPAPDPSSIHSWKYPAIEYITKDGYRSKSLDKYIYMVHVSKEQPSKFTLPTLEK